MNNEIGIKESINDIEKKLLKEGIKLSEIEKENIYKYIKNEVSFNSLLNSLFCLKERE